VTTVGRGCIPGLNPSGAPVIDAALRRSQRVPLATRPADHGVVRPLSALKAAPREVLSAPFRLSSARFEDRHPMARVFGSKLLVVGP
jgi:hypothetical protein